MVDYRKFLGKKEYAVLPWLGGPRLFAKERALRLSERPATHGFWRFAIEGRNAKPVEPADPDFAGMSKLRGHLVGEWLFRVDGSATALELMPREEQPPLSPCVAWVTFGGDEIFGAVEFDQDAETNARAALEEDRSIAQEEGIGASLRAAFAFAVASRVAKKEDVPITPEEIRAHAMAIAEHGRAAVMPILEEIERARNLGRVRVGPGRRVLDVGRAVARADRHRVVPTIHNAEERAESALEAAGARMSAFRYLGDGEIEVKFRFADNRFICRAHAITLNVIDAGICLVSHEDGHRGDPELTLESLPSAIREAMQLGVLVITRRN